VVTIDRLQAVPQGIGALGNRLVAVVLPLGGELQGSE
jgi:hypothetical protein